MKEIILHHHLGLGDHFICNGLVNHLSETYDKIYLVCKSKYVETVSCLYSENISVVVSPIENESVDIRNLAEEKRLQVLKVGFNDFNNQTFDRSFYSQIGLDFSVRYSMFKLPRVIENSKPLYDSLVKKTPYRVVHNKSSDGVFNLDLDSNLDNIYIEEGVTNNLLDYVDIMLNAEEIHCVDSSVYHLVDSIETSAKLYFHDVRCFDNKIKVSDKWVKI